MFSRYADAYFSERGNVSDKWEHYFEIYDHVFGHMYGRRIDYLEIGVQAGGSLEVARKLFASGSRLVGIDIDPACRRLEAEGIADGIFICDQTDGTLPARLGAKYDGFDLVIDDGSHVQADMIVTFLNLFALVRENGIYLIEDTHTHHDPRFQTSFHGIGLYDYFKGLSERLVVDWMDVSNRQGRFTQPLAVRPPKPANGIVDAIFSIEFFDSVIAVRKKTRPEPLRMKR